MTSEPGCPIGCGGDQAEVFECGQDVCKLYRPHIDKQLAKRMAFQEADALKLVEGFDDVPAPQVLDVRQIKDRWGVIMSRIKGQNFASILSDGRQSRPYMEEMARLHVAIHLHQAPGLPALKARLCDEIRAAGTKLGDTLPLQGLLDRLAKLPDGDWLCHGDFQPSNVMGSPGSASIIDWPNAARGDPAVDVCQSWLLMGRSDEALASAYVDTYARESGRKPKDILHLSPIVAAARLADDVPCEVERLKAIVVEGLSH
jgi:aminoglycoside phosphotransferase (APT) family kinase protein